VTAHADIFRDLCEHRGQFQHFPPALTGLIVLDNQSLANSTRCGLARADKTNLARFFSAAPWFPDRVNARRLGSLLQHTKAVCSPKADALLSLEEPLCEHVGSLCDSGDRHSPQGDDTYPLVHPPVTRHAVSGPGRVPVDLRLSRRAAACPQWATCVQRHLPDRPMPTTPHERARVHKEVNPLVGAHPDLQKLHQQLRTTMALGLAVLDAAMQQKGPWSVLLFARWSLAEELVSMARSRKQEWLSLLKKQRNLDTNSVGLQEATGPPIRLEGPPMAVEDLVPRLPPSASRPVTVRDKTSGTFPRAVRLPGLGTVRLVVSCKNAALTGT
jgi:hypothetical protein